VLLKSVTLPPEEFVSVAPVIVNGKNKIVTPAGGVSVTVRPTGTLPITGSLGGVEATWDWLPQLAITSGIATVKRSSVALRILASMG